MEERIRQAVAAALAAAGAPDFDFAIERPGDPAHGDYATNAALVVAKALGRSPRELADELARALMNALDEQVASHVAVAGPGFINITLAPEAVALAIAEADAQGSAWGQDRTNAGTTVNIEYSNPNPFKELHIGHLMSNIVGEALSRLIEASGASVVRDTFGGDVGPHVAKALWALCKEGAMEIADAKQIGAAYARGAAAYEEDATAKEEIDALNTKLYALVAEPESAKTEEEQIILTLWREGREVSMAEFRRLFKILGTKLDYEFYDSDTTEPGLRIVRDGLKKGVFEESEGAVIYRGEKKGLHTLVFITSRGTPTYEAKDIGLAFLKEEKASADESIIVTASEQIGHFKVLLAALEEIAPTIAAKTVHVPHGFLRLTTGKMSSREGNVITADAFIAEVIGKASEKNADPLIAEQVAVGAIKYMVLRQAPGQDIVFDPEKSLSLEGASGPYLQYALVRAKKILAYGGENAGGTGEPAQPYAIERMILHYPEVVERAARALAPNLLVTYLTELASAWNAFYATEQVLGSPEERYKQRLTRAFAHTMTNGLTLLGIPAPDKM